ncbi:MAG: alpha/beta hydrolase [Flavobacteriales bacterium]|nr:alpha/beta hydrolase [Flavobacteriales bacterium]
MPFFLYKDFAIDYVCYGDGSDAILCFHGFGRKAEDFEIFLPLLSTNQRMISINLFAHGKSEFPESRIDHIPLQPNEWKELLEAFSKEQKIDCFHLVGYSMGGRVAMMTTLLMPERVQSVLLMAPDGLKKNPLYSFASGTPIGRWLYRKLIENPKPLFATAKFLNKLGLMNDKLHRFVHVHLDTREKRMQVHDAWIIYRKMFPHLKKLSALIREKKFVFNMIFGKYDSVIRVKLGEKLSRIIGSDQHLHEIELGHRLMAKQVVEYIITKRLWPC